MLWLSGHTHVNWRYQTGINDGVNIDSNGNPIPYPNQKAYKVTNGAAMINLSSANYQAQDARIEVYNDRVIVRARENGEELGGEYNYTWYADGALVKNAAEPTIDTDPEEPDPTRLFDRFENQLNLQQLWVWKDGAAVHPTTLYDARSNVIE